MKKLGTGLFDKGSLVEPDDSCDIPSPYSMRDLLVKLSECLEKHTEADDKWRATVLHLLDERLKEKDAVIELVKSSYKATLKDKEYAEADKQRWFKVAMVSLVAALLCAGVDVLNLVGLI